MATLGQLRALDRERWQKRETEKRQTAAVQWAVTRDQRMLDAVIGCIATDDLRGWNTGRLLVQRLEEKLYEAVPEVFEANSTRYLTSPVEHLAHVLRRHGFFVVFASIKSIRYLVYSKAFGVNTGRSRLDKAQQVSYATA